MSRLEALKEIDIVQYLAEYGYKWVNETGDKYWYLSPLRAEGAPSFAVFKSDNKWKDYGSGFPRGDIIDLVKHMENCDTKEAMDILSEKKGIKCFEPTEINTEPIIRVDDVRTITDFRLIKYAEERCISLKTLIRNCEQVTYSFRDNPDNKYKAIGFKNDSGGYELRSGIHKYATSPKDVTLIRNNGVVLNVFEGFFDYMSALEYFGGHKLLNGDTIVLNGLGMVYKIIDDLSSYGVINIYIDKGKPANQVIDRIRTRNTKVFDHRYILEGEEDFNKFWVEKCNNKR